MLAHGTGAEETMADDEQTQQPPITIPVPPSFPVRWERPDDAKRFWTLDRMHWPEPVTPLDFSLYHAVGFIYGFNAATRAYHLPAQFEVRRINTYRYVAILVPAQTSEAATEPNKQSRGNLETAMAGLSDTWQGSFLSEIKVHHRFWDGFDLVGVSSSALLAHLDDTEARIKRLAEIHFLLWLPLMLALTSFEDLYRGIFPDRSELDAYRLLTGFDNKTLETDRALWELSQWARSSPEVFEALQANAAAMAIVALGRSREGQTFLTRLRAYLDEYGQRGNGWDVSSLSWIEDPTPVVRTLQRYLSQPDRHPLEDLAVLAASRERVVAEAGERLRAYPESVRVRFEWLLPIAQEALVLSEDHGFWLDQRSWYRVRLVLLEFGRRFAAAGVIDERDDIFYLTLPEIRETAEGPPRLDRRRLIAGRRAEMEYFRTIAPPPAIGMAPSSPPPDSPLRRFEAKFWGVSPPPPTEQSILRGSAGSPGTIRGPARVIHTISEAGRLRPGDILIAEMTSPAWSSLFATVAAVVTDTGGVLSHCAVVAWEYGIPAVVGTGNATALVRDGQIVEVDGSAGVVRIVSPTYGELSDA
jgi:rifampicin phosphotransferase